MTGLPPPPPRPGSPRSSRLVVTKPRKCSAMPLCGSPISCFHVRPTRTALPEAPSLACSLRLLLGVPPTPRRAQTLRRARRGRGGAGFPPHPPRGAGSPQSLLAATAPLSSAPPPPAAAPPPGHGRGTEDEGWAGCHGVRWSLEFPGAGPREHGASGCVHAPLTGLLAAGQPLITRGPASSLAEASHTFAADWPAPGPALYPARGAGQAERLPARGGGQTARSAVASTSSVSALPSVV